MELMPPDDTSPSLPYALSTMVVAPLAGQIIGLDESQFVVAEWRAPTAPAGPPQFIAPFHVHYADDEAWYVLEGTLAFRLGNQEVEAPAGTAVFASRGVPHTYWNPHATPARYLLIMTPTLRRLIAELHTSSGREFAAMQAIYHRYNSELIP
jgi:mannose-6-phosphate isomerase-like protein (cupin superfamily)